VGAPAPGSAEVDEAATGPVPAVAALSVVGAGAATIFSTGCAGATAGAASFDPVANSPVVAARARAALPYADCKDIACTGEAGEEAFTPGDIGATVDDRVLGGETGCAASRATTEGLDCFSGAGRGGAGDGGCSVARSFSGSTALAGGLMWPLAKALRTVQGPLASKPEPHAEIAAQ
jgi:hypothetical protein